MNVRSFLKGNGVGAFWEELNISGVNFNMFVGTIPLMAPISDSEIILLDGFPVKSSQSFILDTRRMNFRSVQKNFSFSVNDAQCMQAGENRIATLVDDLQTSDNKRIEVYSLVGDSEDRSTLVCSLSLKCDEESS